MSLFPLVEYFLARCEFFLYETVPVGICPCDSAGGLSSLKKKPILFTTSWSSLNSFSLAEHFLGGRAFLVVGPLAEDICPIDAAAVTSLFKMLSISSDSFFSYVIFFSLVEFFLARRSFFEDEAVPEETFSFDFTAGI